MFRNNKAQRLWSTLESSCTRKIFILEKYLTYKNISCSLFLSCDSSFTVPVIKPGIVLSKIHFCYKMCWMFLTRFRKSNIRKDEKMDAEQQFDSLFLFLFLVHRDSVSHLAQLDLSTADITVRQTNTHFEAHKCHMLQNPLCSHEKCPSWLLFFPQETMVTVLHVTSCQDEFRQQQIAVLWRASGATHSQVTTIIRSHTHTHTHTTVQLIMFIFF